MDGEAIPFSQQAQIRVARLLCILGAILVALYGPLYRAASPDVFGSAWGLDFGVAGLLGALFGASYVSRTIQRRYREITWGLLCFMMAGAAALAAVNDFTGEYALGVVLAYAVFGGVVALVSASMRPVLAFFVVGLAGVGGTLLWTSPLQTNPWAVGGALIVVALVEGAAARGALSARTRLQTQQQELREQDSLLDRVAETSPHAVVRVDADGTLISANSRAEEVLGPRINELLGRPYTELAEQLDAAEGKTRPDEGVPFSQVLREEREIRNRECSVDRSDGSWRRLSIKGAPIRDNDGKIQEAVFHFLDVTAQARRKQALREAQAEAEGADRLKSALLANMSHEIRTPLTAIIGFADAIASNAADLDLPESTPLPGYADLIEQSGKRLLNTLEGVLDLSQLEAGQMDLDAEPVALDDHARRAAEEYRSDARANEIDLQLETTRAQALADVDGVRIVLENLLDNAIKYTGEGGTVRVRTYREPEWAVLEVEDTGAGMEPEMVDQLFEPFRQASTGLSREYEGTGIGLAVTKKAAEAMGGSIEVETEDGRGSRFLARLPVLAPGTGDRGNDHGDQLAATPQSRQRTRTAPAN